ncbi:MAG TPA: hypothetical protein VG204_17635 [Terriglobia bacterium]|nr:hypothetical protein [Terriglobia bacterium]
MKQSGFFQTHYLRAMLVAALFVGLNGAWLAPDSQAAQAVSQGLTDVAPDSAPSIQQIQPAQGAAGATVDIQIGGTNFARDAYVSCSSPEVHVVKAKRASATRVEAKLAILGKAHPGAVTLYVTNPSGSVAQTTFTIVGPVSPSGGAAASAAPGQATTGPEVATSGSGSPEVTSIEPASVTPGSQLTVKIKGKNFAQGARASFSNPGIRVVGTKVEKSSQLEVQIQVASNATTGAGSVFVVNPDDSEVEAHFTVTAGSPVVTATSGESQPATATASATGTAAGSGTTSTSANQKSGGQQFEVYSLGNIKGILGGGSQTKGTLTLSSGKLKYTEGDQQVFAAARKDIKEIGVNQFLGVSTGTFHIMLNSGKTYNFIASSFRPADSQSIVDTLRQALH